MAEPSPLDQLLSEMRSLGRPDSSGYFTIDSGRGQELLERFRLPSASYFMLHAVGAAVSAGARQIDIQLRPDRFELTFDGNFESEDEAGALWSSQRSREILSRQELAIARAGALQWGASELSLLTLPDGRHRLRAPRPGLLRKLLVPLVGLGRREDEELLREHLVPAPDCALTVNGTALKSLTFPREVERATSIGIPSYLDGRSLDLASLAWLESDQQLALAGCQAMFCRLPPGPHAAAWRAPRSYWPGYLDVVLNGRLYRCKLPKAYERCWGIFWVHCLKRDLSRSFIGAEDLELLQQLLARELLG